MKKLYFGTTVLLFLFMACVMEMLSMAKQATVAVGDYLYPRVMMYGYKTGLILFATVFSNTGKAITTNRLKAGGTEPSYVAWGTGAGTAGQTDTTLFTESSEARTAGASTQQTTSTTNDTYQVVGTIVATAGRTITNAGLFDASSSGNIFMKGDFTGVVLASGESIQFTMQVQYT